MDTQYLYSQECFDKLLKIRDKSIPATQSKKRGHRNCPGCNHKKNKFKNKIDKMKGK